MLGPTSIQELKGKPETGKLAWGCILRSQVSAIGYLVQVFWFRCGYGVILFPTAHRQPLTAITCYG